jgi:hypothetical protein
VQTPRQKFRSAFGDNAVSLRQKLVLPLRDPHPLGWSALALQKAEPLAQ